MFYFFNGKMFFRQPPPAFSHFPLTGEKIKIKSFAPCEGSCRTEWDWGVVNQIKKCPPLLKGGGFNEVEDGGFLHITLKNPLGFAVSPFKKGNKKHYKYSLNLSTTLSFHITHINENKSGVCFVLHNWIRRNIAKSPTFPTYHHCLNSALLAA